MICSINDQYSFFRFGTYFFYVAKDARIALVPAAGKVGAGITGLIAGMHQAGEP